MRVRIVLSVLLLLCVLGCKTQKPASSERRFPIEGRVVAVDPAAHTLTLDHHEVAGYMKAMTMPFPVRDAWVFNVVHPGDTVQATLVVADDDYLENISVTQARAAADLSTTSPIHLPQTGELVPDFHFVNQEGRPIHLAQFRGQPLLITLHLFPLSPAGVLHPHQQQLCRDRRDPQEDQPRRLWPVADAFHHHRS